MSITARFRREPKVSLRHGNFVPGDLVRITLQDGDTCAEFDGCHGVITWGPDKSRETGWIVSAAPGSLRCIASELTMMVPREERA